MRSLFLLTVAAVVLLAIDAAKFNSHYRKAAWVELSYQGRLLQYRVERSLDPAVF
jgi:hypothetical protein